MAFTPAFLNLNIRLDTRALSILIDGVTWDNYHITADVVSRVQLDLTMWSLKTQRGIRVVAF